MKRLVFLVTLDAAAMYGKNETLLANHLDKIARWADRVYAKEVTYIIRHVAHPEDTPETSPISHRTFFLAFDAPDNQYVSRGQIKNVLEQAKWAKNARVGIFANAIGIV
jgi:hypothetical protein